MGEVTLGDNYPVDHSEGKIPEKRDEFAREIMGEARNSKKFKQRYRDGSWVEDFVGQPSMSDATSATHTLSNSKKVGTSNLQPPGQEWLRSALMEDLSSIIILWKYSPNRLERSVSDTWRRGLEPTLLMKKGVHDLEKGYLTCFSSDLSDEIIPIRLIA